MSAPLWPPCREGKELDGKLFTVVTLGVASLADFRRAICRVNRNRNANTQLVASFLQPGFDVTDFVVIDIQMFLTELFIDRFGPIGPQYGVRMGPSFFLGR